MWVSTVNRLPSSDHKWFWLSAAAVIRVAVLMVFILPMRQTFPDDILCGFALKQSDYIYFLGPVDEYFEKGFYQYEFMPGKPFAGRMPGYSIPYMMLRFLFSKPAALCILFLSQVLLGILCIYLLSITAEKFFKSRTMFLVTFFISSLSIHTAIFDLFSLSESFSVSAVILFLYFIQRHLETGKNKFMLLAGLVMAWAVFLRPFLGLFIFLVPLVYWLSERKKITLEKMILPVFCFVIPFVIFESAWIVRNNKALGKFVPLETSLNESYGERGAYRLSALSIRQLINCWGGEAGEFFRGSEGEWFHKTPLKEAHNFEFPGYAFNAGFTKDSLVELKRIFNAVNDSSFSEHQKDSLNQLASETALRYARDYRQKNFYRVHVINPVKRFSRIAFANGTMMLPLPPFSQMNLFYKAVKLFYVSVYYGITILGFAGCLALLFKNKKNNSFPVLTAAFYPFGLIFTLVLFSSVTGFRYFLTAYPVFVIFTSWLLVLWLKRKMAANVNPNS